MPFDAPNLKGLVNKILRGPQPHLPHSVSQGLRSVCLDMLSRDSNQRPSCSDLLQRPIIQAEIKKMLKEQDNEGDGNTGYPGKYISYCTKLLHTNLV